MAISCKRKDILRLPLDDYRRFADLAIYGFEEAALLRLIENAMGKPVPREVVEDITTQDSAQEAPDCQEELDAVF